MSERNFFAELKRRNVYKVAVAYAVVGWLLLQGLSIVLPAFEAPAWVLRVFIAAIVTGSFIALVIAWAFEMRPEGLKRTCDISPTERLPYWSTRKFIGVVALIAITAGVLLGLELLRSKGSTVVSGAPIAPPARSIAVLPFENLSDDRQNAYFADGIQDEILTNLASIADLKVISRTSTAKYALRLVEQAADALPIEKDVLAGPAFAAGLVEIRARSGQASAAVAGLRRLLAIPAGSEVSLKRLQLDPVWDPIRNDPEFQQLLAGNEQIGPNK